MLERFAREAPRGGRRGPRQPRPVHLGRRTTAICYENDHRHRSTWRSPGSPRRRAASASSAAPARPPPSRPRAARGRRPADAGDPRPDQSRREEDRPLRRFARRARIRQLEPAEGAGRARHLVPGSFPAHQDPAARRSRSRDRRSRQPSPHRDSIADYRADYAAYYERCRHPDSPPMRDPNPVVFLVPGIGMITFARDKATARIASEFYRNAINVMRGAATVDAYVGLPEQEAFDIEYWLLEEAKLQRMPKPKSLAGRIALVTGGGRRHRLRRSRALSRRGRLRRARRHRRRLARRPPSPSSAAPTARTTSAARSST